MDKSKYRILGGVPALRRGFGAAHIEGKYREERLKVHARADNLVFDEYVYKLE